MTGSTAAPSAMVSINGVVSTLEAARVAVADRGFLYGDSAFEVVRSYGRVPFRLRAHLERLERSCERLAIIFPVTVEVLENEVAQALAAAEGALSLPATGEWYIRVVVTRGVGPLRYDPASAVSPSRVIIVAPLPVVPAEHYQSGAKAVCLRVSRLVDDPRAAGTKASNYLSSLLALSEAQSHGAYEALVVGPGGGVLEGTTSNLFVLRSDGSLVTPPLSTGILAGITRALVIEALAGQNVNVSETMVFPSDLYRAKEVFITSTIREVVPLVTVDGATVGSGHPGKLTRQAHAAFRALTGQPLPAGPES